MGKFIDLTRKKFGRLTVESRVSDISHKWNCICDCGSYAVVAGGNLRSGHTRSCGCLASEVTSAVKTKHGYSRKTGRNGMYPVWAQMIARCTRKTHKQYPDYGGRGITVYEEWAGKDGFIAFLRDMGERPLGTSLDRIDNNSGYSPWNCRWADRVTQARNTRKNRFLTIGNESKTIAEWAVVSGIGVATIQHRIRSGKTDIDIISKLDGRSVRHGKSRQL